jgi:hypothetical protein
VHTQPHSAAVCIPSPVAPDRSGAIPRSATEAARRAVLHAGG